MSTVIKYCTNEFWLVCHIQLNTHAPLCRTVSKEGKPVCNSACVILELRWYLKNDLIHAGDYVRGNFVQRAFYPFPLIAIVVVERRTDAVVFLRRLSIYNVIGYRRRLLGGRGPFADVRWLSRHRSFKTFMQMSTSSFHEQLHNRCICPWSTLKSQRCCW